MMSPELEITRGNNAQRVLSDAMYVEAFNAIETRLVDMMASADLDDARGTHLRHLLTAHRKVKQYMEQVMLGGKLAAQEIERERKLKERMRDASRVLRRA